MNRAIDSFNTVKDQASWDAEIQTLKESGIDVQSVLGSTEWTPLNYTKAHRLVQGLAARRDVVADRVAEMNVGLPGETPKPLYEPSFQYIGTDPQGRPVVMNTRTGQGQQGYNQPVLPKPSAATSTFQLKRNAWLSVHPNDQNGALEFANGKRRMDPGQMQAEAMRLANQQMGDATLAGEVIENPDQWIRVHAQQNYLLISGAGAAPARAGGAAGATGVAPRPAAPMSAADKQTSIVNARAALKQFPNKRAIILAMLKAQGISTAGL